MDVSIARTHNNNNILKTLKNIKILKDKNVQRNDLSDVRFFLCHYIVFEYMWSLNWVKRETKITATKSVILITKNHKKGEILEGLSLAISLISMRLLGEGCQLAATDVHCIS